MKMHHIDDFKCTLCSNWFCPPYNLPYLLPCTHSICTHCIQKISASKQSTIICPQDLESCSLKQLHINTTTKKALERLMKQHKNYNQNTQLECIKALSLSFDEILSSKQKHLRNLQILVDQVFANEISRLKKQNQKIKAEINRPFRIIDDWKEIVTNYLTTLKQNHKAKDLNNSSQLFHYIEQGRKIKMQLLDFFTYDFDSIANDIVKNPLKCFGKKFQLFISEYKYSKGSEKHNRSLTNNNQPFQKIKGSEEKKNFRNFSRNDPTDDKFYEEQVWKFTETSNHQTKNTNKLIPEKENFEKKSMRKNSGILQGLKDLSNLPIEFERDSNHNSIKEKTMKISSSAKKNEAFHELLIGEDDDEMGKQSVSHSKNSASIHRKNLQISQDKELSLSQFHLYSQNDLSGYCKQYEGRETMKNSRPYKKETENQYKLRQTQKNSDALDIPDKNLQASNNSRLLSSNNSHSRNGSMLLLSPGIIKQRYTEQAEECDPYFDNDQMLLGNEKNDFNTKYNQKQTHYQGPKQKTVSPWIIGNHNFLKEWEIKREKPEEQLEIKQKGFYNCEKQKSTYTRKMQILRAQEAYKLTVRQDNYIQVINEPLHDVDMNLYLSMFQWHGIQIIKLVRTSLTDDQLNVLLNFIINSKVKALVLSGNNLTDITLDAFLHFVTINKTVKNVYLPKNYINILKNKAKINLLKEHGINIYI